MLSRERDSKPGAESTMIARSELSSSPFSRWQHSMNVLECASKIPRGRANRRARARPDRRRIPLRLRHRSLVRPPVAPGGGNSRSQGQSNAQTNQRRHRNTYKDARAREPRRIGGRGRAQARSLTWLRFVTEGLSVRRRRGNARSHACTGRPNWIPSR